MSEDGNDDHDLPTERQPPQFFTIESNSEPQSQAKQDRLAQAQRLARNARIPQYGTNTPQYVNPRAVFPPPPEGAQQDMQPVQFPTQSQLSPIQSPTKAPLHEPLQYQSQQPENRGQSENRVSLQSTSHKPKNEAMIANNLPDAENSPDANYQESDDLLFSLDSDFINTIDAILADSTKTEQNVPRVITNEFEQNLGQILSDKELADLEASLDEVVYKPSSLPNHLTENNFFSPGRSTDNLSGLNNSHMSNHNLNGHQTRNGFERGGSRSGSSGTTSPSKKRKTNGLLKKDYKLEHMPEGFHINKNDIEAKQVVASIKKEIEHSPRFVQLANFKDNFYHCYREEVKLVDPKIRTFSDVFPNKAIRLEDKMSKQKLAIFLRFDRVVNFSNNRNVKYCEQIIDAIDAITDLVAKRFGISLYGVPKKDRVGDKSHTWRGKPWKVQSRITSTVQQILEDYFNFSGPVTYVIVSRYAYYLSQVNKRNEQRRKK